VTKVSIKDSGLGKAVGAVERHKICKGSPHENAIVQRVERIKQAWHARVKSQKMNDAATIPSSATNELKRPIDNSTHNQTVVKKMKPEEKKATVNIEEKKVSSFSSLLKKVSAPSSSSSSNVNAPSTSKVTAVNIGAERSIKDAPAATGVTVGTKKGKWCCYENKSPRVFT
jgi:hypothetical protein